MGIGGDQCSLKALMRKEHAGIERVWGKLLVNVDAVLDPPFSLFPLQEYDKRKIILHVYKPFRMTQKMDYVSELIGVEEITTPAGTYEAYHLKQTYKTIYGTARIEIWYSPEVRQYVRIEIENLPFVGDLHCQLTDFELLM